MKYKIFAAFFLISNAIFGQVKISQMTPYSGNMNGVLVPGVTGGLNRSIDLGSFSTTPVLMSNYFDNGGPAKTGQAIRVGNILSGLIDTYTGENVSFTKVTTYVDGTQMTDAKIDSVIYVKKGTEYFKRNFSGAITTKWFGLKGDGTDETAKLQAAINFASLNSMTLVIPTGDYFVSNAQIKSNLIMVAEKGAVLHRITGTADNTYVLGCNFNNSTDPAGINNVKNVTITGIGFRGTSDSADGFREFRHLLNMSGIENVLVDRCTFTAFNGDGLYIGSGIGSTVEKHNKNVLVTNCIFDGVNSLNRNAISIIDVDGIVIRDNKFSNTTSSNMPGAIDVEPDPSNYHIIKNVTIENNDFKKIKGNVAAISFYLPLSQTTFLVPVKNITIRNNTIDSSNNGISILQRNRADTTTSLQTVVVENNKVYNTTGRPFYAYGIGDLKLNKNLFQRFTTSIYIGYKDSTLDYQCYNVSLMNNTIKDNNVSGDGITIYNVKGYSHFNNTFENINTPGGYSVAITGASLGKSEGVNLVADNVFGNISNYAAINASHVTTKSLNFFQQGIWDKARVSSFPFSPSINIDYRFRDVKNDTTSAARLIGNYRAGLSYVPINGGVGWPNSSQGIVHTYYDDNYGKDGIGFGWQEFQSRVTLGGADYMRRYIRQPATYDSAAAWGQWLEYPLISPSYSTGYLPDFVNGKIVNALSSNINYNNTTVARAANSIGIKFPSQNERGVGMTYVDDGNNTFGGYLFANADVTRQNAQMFAKFTSAYGIRLGENSTAGSSGIGFYGDVGLTANTFYTPTRRMFIANDGTVQITGNVTAATATASNQLVTRQQVTDTLAARILFGSATLTFPSIASQTSSELTITVTGAVDGDVVSMGYQNVSRNAGIIYTARVSAANTVSITAYNITVATITPLAGVFQVRVIK